ncbi:hypothetical protein [Humidisolicoccus flavus]|uniref:hypothetical protein n=1 Tax=Humidisolicoccus flavus TaxID=3111414 RepID=UPI003247F846
MQFSAFKSAVATLRAQPFASTHALALLIVVALFVQGLTESRPLIELGFVLLVAVIVRGRERATASPSSAPSRAVTS